MGFLTIRFERDGPLARVTLARPERRNALSLNCMRELIDCLNTIDADDRLRAVILAAEGKVFCAGHDLSEMTSRTVSEYRRLFDVCSEMMMKIQSIRQPVIAAIQGIATAAGLCRPSRDGLGHHGTARRSCCTTNSVSRASVSSCRR